MAYTLRAALRSRLIQRVIVSTEDPEIRRIAEEFGAEVFERPVQLARDETPTIDVLLHVLKTLQSRSETDPGWVVTLQPNCPFRTADFIDEAIGRVIRSKADSLLSISECRLKLGDIQDGFFVPRYAEGLRKQELAVRYRENGILYVTRTEVLLGQKSMFGKKILPLVVTEERLAVNIDTPFDFEVAGALLKTHPEWCREVMS